MKTDISGVPEAIARCVRTILTTPVGTVVLDRSFGVDTSILDMPLAQARALYAAEILEKIRRYEPRVRVDEINILSDAERGTLYPKVVLSLVT